MWAGLWGIKETSQQGDRILRPVLKLINCDFVGEMYVIRMWGV